MTEKPYVYPIPKTTDLIDIFLSLGFKEIFDSEHNTCRLRFDRSGEIAVQIDLYPRDNPDAFNLMADVSKLSSDPDIKECFMTYGHCVSFKSYEHFIERLVIWHYLFSSKEFRDKLFTGIR